MRASVAHRFHPKKGGKYEKLTPFEQVEVCQTLLADMRSRGLRDHEDYSRIIQEEFVARRMATLMSPFWDVTHNLFVETESGEKVLFKPRPAQEILLEKYQKCVDERKPMRILLPKPRRLGMSEVAAKIGHAHVFRRDGFHGLMLAQNSEDALKIFRKYQIQISTDKLGPKVKTLAKNEISLLHSGSSMAVRSAGASAKGNSGIGRGQIFHFLHGSEVAFWPEAAIRMMTGILSTMPRWPIWETVAILESTGNGRDGYFYNKVREALDGDSDWEVHFLPFTALHDCVRPFEDPKERLQLEEELHRADADEEERELFFKHGATLEVVNWRRWAIRNLVDGVDYAERKRNFYQEYPLHIEDCFQASGANVFDHDKITRQMRRCTPPKWTGTLTSPTALWSKRSRGHVPITPMPRFKKEQTGKLRVWSEPEPGHEYILGVDPSHGEALGDPSVIIVIDRQTERIVAEYRDHCDQEDLVGPCRLISRWYNDAWINIEVNLGRLLIKWLKGTDRRRCLFRRRDESLNDQVEDAKAEYGWNTTSKSKRVLIGFLKEHLEHNPMLYSYVEILAEMKDFRMTLNRQGTDVIYPGVRGGAGKHDDRVMACAMAVAAHVFLRAPSYTSFGRQKAEELTVEDRWDTSFKVKKRRKPQRRKVLHPVLGEDY